MNISNIKIKLLNIHIYIYIYKRIKNLKKTLKNQRWI